jgi:hypothetical protein
MPLDIVMILKSQTDLFEIVLTLRASGGFARGLNRGQEQRNQNPNDRNHH